MTENQVPAWTPAGELTAVPAANDNVPSELRALGAAIGKDAPHPSRFVGMCEKLAATDVCWPSAPTHAANDNFPPVVAFTGQAGAGKSTATRYLVEQHGYTLVKFAGPLKDMMRALGFGDDDIEGSCKELSNSLLCGKSPRHAMQTLGTQWGRDCIGEDFWINLWKDTAEHTIAHGGRVVTDDCRFPNEALAVRRLGGDIYKLIGRGGIAGDHVSERGCGDEDLTIANAGAVEELHGKIEEALRRYG
ncbi:deoxynucleotide monophosphate kinase [Rhizobium laguerreae]|uniref:deoxynucleotide monophosphate kinase family protein n=1 Tax=Rhizobium laguerreae TaxID=1076926 RepID=UPI001C9155EA|nr:deoxynucleotide monophosphate kinase [Rhizobium laguerreae]MBY3263904.1 deoxynucleotide monophosphate kinase [Rhizobium laguerreae]